MAIQNTILRGPELTKRQFEKISRLVHGLCGINLHSGKQELVKARLNKRLRRLGLRSFSDYIDCVHADQSGGEMTAMLDALCTNLTRFFREKEHFVHLARHVLPRVDARSGLDKRKLRIWSAGCASGEEPYSIAMTLAETLKDRLLWDIGILGTDLSSTAVASAVRGEYELKQVSEIPLPWRSKYLDVVRTDVQRRYRIKDSLRSMMHFAKLNLMDSWPMQGAFDAIFCRNVMIYFDKETQAKLVDRFSRMLTPGGVLFLGHSESLAGVEHKLRYVQPTVYEHP
ncbi:MAG: protein-glutamate O-methyltransferase [Phycisphaerae bacterium]|jgi:chemotaxis protein methyltransferase CheR|nr:protein-glutamate O-methyltransferase [Phycisphaerae bacterium]